MKIRGCQSDDLGKLAKVYTDSYNHEDIEELWTVESAEKLLSRFYELQPDLFFVAESDTALVGGTVAVAKPWWNGNHITDGELFVAPNAQGEGVGRKLLKKLFTEAKSKYGAVSWDTFTHTYRDHPLKWYKSLWFSEIDKWTMIHGNIDEVLDKMK